MAAERRAPLAGMTYAPLNSIRGVIVPLLLIILIIGLTSGCAGVARKSEEPLAQTTPVIRRCGPPPGILQTISPPSQGDSPTPEEAAPSVPAGFSPQALEIAEIIGIRDLLVQMPLLETEVSRGAEGATLRLLWARQQLSDRMLLALFEVKRTAAETDCEEERADQLADRLHDKLDTRVRYQTLIAIVGDALVGILSGGLELAAYNTAAAAGAIAGGVIATGFGSAALFGRGEQVDFRHERNLLKDVWEGPQRSLLFPESVWRFLNRPLKDDPAGRSLRETLIARWRRHGRLDDPGSEAERRRIALFFGEGGTYEIDDLRDRAAMLDLLESDINLMSHDLERLMQEVLGREAARRSLSF